jgi:hypothetical protein
MSRGSERSFGSRTFEPAAEVERTEKDLRRGPHRQQSTGVDQLEANRHLLRGGHQHVRIEERGIIVGDNHTRTLRERLQQSAPLAGAAFEIGVVQDRLLCRVPGVVGHPLDDELVQSVAGPAIVRSQRF